MVVQRHKECKTFAVENNEQSRITKGFDTGMPKRITASFTDKPALI